MDLMLALAPYNKAIIDLMTQTGDIIAVRISVDEDVSPEKATKLLDIVTEAAEAVDAHLGGLEGMTAAEAAKQSDANDDSILVLGAPEDLEGEIFKAIWVVCLEAVKERSSHGKRTVTMEPFGNLPGKLHPINVEESVMEKVEKNLRDRQYKDIEWDRRDGRVVLQFGW